MRLAQDFKLQLKLEDGTVNIFYNIPLPCSLNKICCDSRSTDPYAYTWENRKLFYRRITLSSSKNDTNG